MPRRILVVDDEPKMRAVLSAYLAADGFEPVEAATGTEALASMAPDIDLVLLDVGLPDLDGFEVLARLRAMSDVYVILVTARAEEADRVEGLGVGADDYVTKPFSPRELVARVRAVLRRPREAPEPPTVLDFGDLVIDLAGREVEVEGARVEVTPLDFDLLALLASDPGRAFTRRSLLERVWGYDHFGDTRVVDVHVRSLRLALRDNANEPRVVGTVRGIGYKFLLSPAGRS